MSHADGHHRGITRADRISRQLMALLARAQRRAAARQRLCRCGAVVPESRSGRGDGPVGGDSALLAASWRGGPRATSLNENRAEPQHIELTNYELSGYSSCPTRCSLMGPWACAAFFDALFTVRSRGTRTTRSCAAQGAAKPLGVLTWAGCEPCRRSAATPCALSDVAGMFANCCPAGTDHSVCWIIHLPSIASYFT